ncbi:MAG TPA: DUF4157 domain-containing protein [Candidatus Angelobacter sp.]|jgi:hypothetical protein
MNAKTRVRRPGNESKSEQVNGSPAAASPVATPLQQIRGLQSSVGNQNTLQMLRASQHLNGGHLEAEAEHAAAGRPAAPLSKLPANAGKESSSPIGDGGSKLDAALRKPMEARLGADLSQVKVHTGAGPAEMNQSLNSRAFTYGQDIYFGRSEYAPETDSGSRLLTHELAHTVQQSSGTKAIQEQPKGGGATQPEITAQGIIGMPQGSKVVLTRTMTNFFFNLVSSNAPEVAGALNAIDQQNATLSIATDDLVEIKLDQTVNLPASDGKPAVGYKDVTVSLKRTAPGIFDFAVAGTPTTEGATSLAYRDTGLTATQSGGSYILSSGKEDHLRITPGAGPSAVASIEAFTGPYLSQMPAAARGLAPKVLDLVSMTKLPDAAAPPAEQKEAVQQIIASAARQRSGIGPRQSAMLGSGLLAGARLDPLLTASWSYRFRVSPKLNNFVQIPLEAELMYAPSNAVLGTVSSGGFASLSDLNIPLNIRLITGFGAGQVEGNVPKGGGPRPELSVLGPTVGAGVGFEKGWFRVDIRYEHLFNILGNAGPGQDVGALRVGAAF